MLNNYLIIAWRNIWKSKGFSMINIFGLAIGMAVALVIGIWVQYEYSYDRFLTGNETLFQVMMNYTNEGEKSTYSSASLPLSEVILDDIPEIENVAVSDWMGPHNLTVDEKVLIMDGAQIGADFLTMFQYPLINGKAETCLQEPRSIVLTKSTAIALFGEVNPMGKTVRFDAADDLKVTGILEDLPPNSSFDFNYLVPFNYYESSSEFVQRARSQWANNSFQIFVKLNENADPEKVGAKVKDLTLNREPLMDQAFAEVILHPLKDWRLYSKFENGKASGGLVDYLIIFSIVGILVLLIACINFTNLSTARSEKRAKEVGIRKVLGSPRKHLIIQYLSESVMMSLAAFVIALLLTQLFLPAFNTLAGTSLALPFLNPFFWLVALAYVLITGLLAGSGPAFYLSSFKPIKVLKGKLTVGKNVALPRKILVVAQFSCSIALIIGTVIIYQQIQHAKNRPLGYDLEKLLVTPMTADLQNSYEVLKNEVLQSGMVEHMTTASSPVTQVYSHSVVQDWPGKLEGTQALDIASISVSDDYFETLGMSLQEGRDFAGLVAADSGKAILNETAVRALKLEDPINQTISWDNNLEVQIIGVVRDAIMRTPFEPVEPAIFVYDPEESFVIYRLADSVSPEKAIAQLSPIFSKYNPSYPYEYEFTDQAFDRNFRLESLIGKLAWIFAALACFISCLGLFGLAAYMAEQRTKEVSIRKILGASVGQLWMLLSNDFLRLVLISCLVAAPIAWYFLQDWLQDYDYRITIGPGAFIAAGGLAILITILTVSYQAIRAALVNPGVVLRNE